MTALVWIIAILILIILFLFFPFRFNVGGYAELKSKKFGAKIYLFNFLKLFEIEGVADGLQLDIRGTINKRVDLLKDKMDKPKWLYLLKALRPKKFIIGFWHDITTYFANGAALKMLIDLLSYAIGPVTFEKYNTLTEVNFVAGKEALTFEGVLGLQPINIIILLLKKAGDKLWNNKIKYKKS